MEGKSTLALCRQPPYGNALAREGLEAVLAAAAMDLVPDLLFLSDGVFQLLDNQSPAEIHQKSLQRNLQALPMFGIEQIFVCGRSLIERGISADQITIPGVEVHQVQDTGKLIAAYDTVLSF
ncbi:sulfurtransferase complex subunit TusC [Microbulbifer thermotolerans]|uniref:sulfurtransferase complex subunit TusC n=1 Tax=Microbulbifer thermotolerans TaxID=252514 RepID=UPI00224B6097|nr:sulfurtransferase complex subunit TusC [Microbulbifer thermotolerans]MCX2779334.1 sulfurtransferase complex subunit TusC [Microbulbifer thermotolerans]MCX2805764.1 sulfurtransferase complex subunit TusC [Microbulbifer thermotolerans]WKT62119.1 sulfurtransferase complex subunit TusC [Microbulbifer thermotolerans]